MTIFEKMTDAVIRGSKKDCIALAGQALKEGIEPIKAIQEGFSKGMETIGCSFESGKIFLPEMMESAEAMDAGVKIFKPVIAAKGTGALHNMGKILLATIQGDMHDIGKNIVKLLMSGAGFEVIDLGKDVKVSKIIDDADEKEVDIIGLSALMTTTMGYMPEIIEEISELGLRKEFKVMVGGAPVTEEWSKEIDADGYAKDAVGAVRVARELQGK